MKFQEWEKKKKIIINSIPKQAIAEIVGYLWDKEKEDFECFVDGEPERENHIFLNLQTVRNWLETK